MSDKHVSIERVISGFHGFRESYYENNPALFQTLVESGQNPDIAIVACSDSRVDPAILFNTGPGELFVVRNVANLVPPYEPDASYHGTSAALEFAVRDLKVGNIVVLGHAHCGGIQAMVKSVCSDAPSDRDFICSWVSIAQDVVDEAHPPTESEAEQSALCVSLGNLETYPWIRDRVAAGDLALHGWWFDMDAGALLGWDADTGMFKPL